MIKDRVYLGTVAGMAGALAKMAVDEVSIRLKISQRSFRTTAAGMWVSSFREANSVRGQILGSLLDIGLSWAGGIGIVGMLSKTGADHAIWKGAGTGIAFGSAITAITSGLPLNRISPKDAASNLSHMLAHAVYGLVAAKVATALGDPSLWMELQPVAYAKRWVGQMKK